MVTSVLRLELRLVTEHKIIFSNNPMFYQVLFDWWDQQDLQNMQISMERFGHELINYQVETED